MNQVNTNVSKLPVIVLTGGDPRTKNDVLKAWFEYTNGTWAVLSSSDAIAAQSSEMRFALGGCACCTGKLTLMTTLTKVLREFRRPNIRPIEGVVIELPAGGDTATMVDQLAQPLLENLIDVRLVMHVLPIEHGTETSAQDASLETAWLVLSQDLPLPVGLSVKVSTCSKTILISTDSFAAQVAQHQNLRYEACLGRRIYESNFIFNRSALYKLIAENSGFRASSGVFRTERDWYRCDNGQWAITRFRRYSYWQEGDLSVELKDRNLEAIQACLLS